MAVNFNGVEIHLKIEADIHVAPIHSHHVLQAITNIVKDITELERNGHTCEVKSELSLNYLPVCKEERINQ